MAFSTVDTEGRLTLHMDLCEYVGFECGTGTQYYIVDMDDLGTTFDLVSDVCKRYVHAVVKIDNKSRIAVRKWNLPVDPIGKIYQVTANREKKLLHIKLIPQEN